jgi:oxaloacetate decarboxylase gamma subunit
VQDPSLPTSALQEPSLIDQGLQMMAFGMGTVFVFLTLLIFATKAMSALALRYFPEPTAPATAAVSTRAGASASEELNATLVAAITAAVHAHRAKNDKR